MSSPRPRQRDRATNSLPFDFDQCRTQCLRSSYAQSLIRLPMLELLKLGAIQPEAGGVRLPPDKRRPRRCPMATQSDHGSLGERLPLLAIAIAALLPFLLLYYYR